MTARTLLNRRSRRYAAAFFPCVGLCTAAAALAHLTGNRNWSAAFAVGLPVCFVATLYAQLVGLRCPWCHGNLSPLLGHSGRLTFGDHIQCCPYCRQGLDDGLAEVAVDQPAADPF